MVHIFPTSIQTLFLRFSSSPFVSHSPLVLSVRETTSVKLVETVVDPTKTDRYLAGISDLYLTNLLTRHFILYPFRLVHPFDDSIGCRLRRAGHMLLNRHPPRCGISIFCCKMSIACILSGSFHQIKNSIYSGNLKFLKLPAGGTFGNVGTSRRCRSRTIVTEAVGRSKERQVNKSSRLNLNLVDNKGRSLAAWTKESSKVQELRNIQNLTSENRNIDSKPLEWPAAVLVFDIETTGFSREERIIEIAFRDLLGGTNSTFETLVNPEKVVTNAYIHGISTRMVTKPGVPRMKDLIPIMLNYVESRQIPGKPVILVAHNGRRFDIPFFIREFDRCCTQVPPDWLFVDTLPLARKLVKPDGSKLSSISLQALREHYDIPLVGQCHRAMQDVIILSMVLQKISFELKLSVADLMETAFKASDLIKCSSSSSSSSSS